MMTGSSSRRFISSYFILDVMLIRMELGEVSENTVNTGERNYFESFVTNLFK